MIRDKSKDNIIKILAQVEKLLNEAPVPTEGRMLYDPETGELIKTPEKNKYPVTRPESAA